MCVYCMIADWGKEFAPPDRYQWTRPMLDQFEELLKRVKELEDKVDPCPCPDESKMDFLKEIRDKLDEIERRETSKSDD